MLLGFSLDAVIVVLRECDGLELVRVLEDPGRVVVEDVLPFTVDPTLVVEGPFVLRLVTLRLEEPVLECAEILEAG